MSEQWRFSQCFGEAAVDELTDADILSAVEFDETGRFLATGDKGGRIVVFEMDPTTGAQAKATSKSPRATSSRKGNRHNLLEYRFHAEFQSHEPEFDYLKSLEIEEKINKIKWCAPSNDALFLLSTNDKTIKLWKIYEHEIQTVASSNVAGSTAAKSPNDQPHVGRPTTPTVSKRNAADSRGSSGEYKTSSTSSTGKKKNRMKTALFSSMSDLRFPRLTHVETVVACHPRRVFSNAHAYHVNSISVNSDGESYMSADDLRINLWNLSISNQSFNVVDIKPENMEELTEVITAAEFHPTQCNVLMYSSSRGSVKLGDMRERALCDAHSKLFEEDEQSGEKSFFSEIIASISDVVFTKDGRYIVSRDYLTLKIWDVKMESRPVKTIHIHEHLRPKLCDLYENDCIFDKFECAVSGDGKQFATGGYHNYFHVYDRTGKNDVCIEASNAPQKRGRGARTSKIVTDPDQLDFGKKALNMAWHPQQDTLAVCALNNLFLFSKTTSNSRR